MALPRQSQMSLKLKKAGPIAIFLESKLCPKLNSRCCSYFSNSGTAKSLIASWADSGMCSSIFSIVMAWCGFGSGLAQNSGCLSEDGASAGYFSWLFRYWQKVWAAPEGVE